MSNTQNLPSGYYYNDSSDLESNISESDIGRPPQPTFKWYKPTVFDSWTWCTGTRKIALPLDDTDSARIAKTRRLYKNLSIGFAVLVVLGIAATVTYISLVASLIKRLDPPRINSGLQRIVTAWQEPDADGSYKFEWMEDFSRNIVPKNCHSHNDYSRSVPLYEALSAGCVSIEVDIWLTDSNELLVSHSWDSTTNERTLRSLYLDPLANVFTHRNVSVASTEPKTTGLFDVDPNKSTILLIDFKNDGYKTWPVLLEQLQPFRENNWLTYFDGDEFIPGPLTVVGTGNTPFDLVQKNNKNRFIFFDAPLLDVSNKEYNSTNSYYASVNLEDAIGHLWLNRITDSQRSLLNDQIKAADDKSLKSRYWNTPGWPISLRDNMWFELTENNVSMLNVDDLVSATRWNWNWCIVAGLTLCGKR